jgi:hypothetical protein
MFYLRDFSLFSLKKCKARTYRFGMAGFGPLPSVFGGKNEDVFFLKKSS